MSKIPVGFQRKALLLILTGTGFFAFLLAGNLIWQVLQARFMKVEPLTQGKVRQTVQFKGCLIKNETLVSSPARGQWKLLVQDGERVSSGKTVGMVTALQVKESSGAGNVMHVYAPMAGLISNKIDGLENLLRFDNIETLEMTEMEKLSKQRLTPGSDTAVEKGQPVIKIVDNLSPIKIWTSLSQEEFPSENLIKDKFVDVIWEDNVFRARVENIQSSNGSMQILFNASAYPQQILNNRWLDIELVKGELTGFLVPENAIVEKNGIMGMYVLDKQGERWIPVEIRGKSGSNVVIDSNQLNNQTRILVNPVWLPKKR